MSKYFTVTVIPDLIQGDVSDIIGNQTPSATDKAFGNTDILFDWASFDVPKGACKLESVACYVMGEDGGNQNDSDISLIFAKSDANGDAPTSLGAPNAVQTAGFDMPAHFLGGVKLEGSTDGQGTLVGPAFGQVYTAANSGVNGPTQTSIILQGEPDSGTNVGFDKLYIAGFAGEAGIDFSTGVKPDAQATTSTDTISVDGTDARKCFQVGDTVYTNTDDTPLGTVKSVTATSIVLNANLAAQVEDNEEIVNANPIRLILGFSK